AGWGRRAGRAAAVSQAAHPGVRRQAHPSESPRARPNEFLACTARVVDGFVELVVVLEGLLNALGLESLALEAPVQRVNRLLLRVELGEQGRHLLGRAARAVPEALAHGADGEASIGKGIGSRDDPRPVEVAGDRVHDADRIRVSTMLCSAVTAKSVLPIMYW